MIFDIKKFAIHDGPGIRTTVFFQGCPLDCWWCHNPECKSSDFRIFPSLSGEELSVRVFDEIRKDVIFYDQSGGGVTFSGGEPMTQVDFLRGLLEACKDAGIHTAVDTCGHTEFSGFQRINELVDLYLYDIKMIDDEAHIKYTGVSNKTILDNLSRLAPMARDIDVRIPLIPGITDTLGNLTDIAELAAAIKVVRKIELLPFNVFGRSKYRKLNIPDKMKHLPTQSREDLEAMAAVFRNSGFIVKV